MRFAIISITKNGHYQAERIAHALKNHPTVIKVDLFQKNVLDTVKNTFNNYDCIIGIMATGIMVRSICSLLKDKKRDPAILIVDESGLNVISLVSGHLGGANFFTDLLSHLIDANPVITTATDLNNIMGVDSLARKYWLYIENTSPLKIINSALVEEKIVKLYIPPEHDFLEHDPLINNHYQIKFWNAPEIRVEFEEVQLDLIPLKMVAGVGSRRGVSAEQVSNSLENAMNYLKLPIQRLNSIATGEMKKDESGIIEVAWNHDLLLEIASLDEIRNYVHPDITPSPWVEKNFKVAGVAEPSALIKAGPQSRLILRKTTLNGVSVSVSVSTVNKEISPQNNTF